MMKHLAIGLCVLATLLLGCSGSKKATGDADEDARDGTGDTSGDMSPDVPGDVPAGDAGDEVVEDGPVDVPGADGDAATDSGGECVDFYRDSDDDGYGDPADHVCTNTAPEGYVDNDEDCCDLLDDVNPAQTSWFDEDYDCGTVTGSFDYNCDTVEEQRWTVLGSCTTGSDGSCVGTEGWHGSTVPDCGLNRYWMGPCTRSSTGTTCVSSSSMRVQECR
jgi:hypothetical protein